MQSFLKPELDEVNTLLRERNGLIVHFSGCPKGVGGTHSPVPFPGDLQLVLSGGAQSGLSCSVVLPGDCFDRFRDDCKATGTIGVVVRLNAKGSLVAADVKDCGSSTDETGFRWATEKDITISSLKNTIEGRERYNEWVVRDYQPLGLFVAGPMQVWDLNSKAEGGQDSIADARPITLCELRGHFPGQPIYTFYRGQVVCLLEQGYFYPASAAQ